MYILCIFMIYILYIKVFLSSVHTILKNVLEINDCILAGYHNFLVVFCAMNKLSEQDNTKV